MIIIIGELCLLPKTQGIAFTFVQVLFSSPWQRISITFSAEDSCLVLVLLLQQLQHQLMSWRCHPHRYVSILPHVSISLIGAKITVAWTIDRTVRTVDFYRGLCFSDMF